MADNKQPMKALQGVSTPSISGVDALLMSNSMSLADSVSATMNPSGGEYLFSISRGAVIGGLFVLRFSLPAGNISAVVSVSARAANGLGENNTINIISASQENSTVAELMSFEIRENSNATEIALIARIRTTSNASATINVGSFGDCTPVVNTNPMATWTVPGQYLQLDSRATTVNNLYEGINVNLNTIKTPGMLSCNPAMTGTSPVGDGIGVCITFGSVSSGVLSQLFIAPTGFAWTRATGTDRSTYGTWRQVLNDSTRQEILDTAGTTSIINAIIFS